jgi:hypothetical protein
MEARGVPACSLGLACSVEDDARIPCCNLRNKTNHPIIHPSIPLLLSTMYQDISLSLTDVGLDQPSPARVAILNMKLNLPCAGLQANLA